MKGFLLPFALVAAFIIAGGVPANAGMVWAVPSEAPGYLINPSATSVNVLEAFIETPSGVTFDTPGFTNLDTGWSAITVNPTYAVEYGSPSSVLTEDLYIIGSPLIVDFYAFTGCTSFPCPVGDLSDAYAVHFNDGNYGGWTALTADNLSSEDTTATAPEPATMLLIGSGFIGLAMRLRAVGRQAPVRTIPLGSRQRILVDTKTATRSKATMLIP